ncbi:SDR family NAD(P)-dependent oxidoreductase [Halococcus salifodinae]|uniref:Short-chain dehydrogenase/reductase SDR n=1 Tax=Halococcus salifodinae DSM 8989 TaxID=1227456 RepID=M0N9K8_9EURY|nr:SDR family NAD(P)-dependent oxidoreductase [Halococcus salifodinae]EMA54637.1 short-chain dehydrogenase/reductase SDR [Halococcus salifodinae DSM 8989]
MERTAIIGGVGPRIGESVARKFAAEGCSVGLFARSEDYLEELAAELTEQTDGEAIAVPTDITDPAQVEAGFERVRSEFGPVDILLNNAYPAGDTDSGLAGSDDGPLGAGVAAFERSWRVWAYGAFLCSEQAAADMLAEDGGTILFTSASFALRGGDTAHNPAGFAGRGLARSLAHQLWPEGVHVANVLVDGSVAKPGQRDWSETPDEEWIHPDHVADSYWHLVKQHPSAWTLELDLRAYAAPIRFG